ncbi:MAG TPA: alcohol dehydrogenase catalytic domain-containing protein [Candidatus Binataceae bacterium]|nr:alcohol dehydrogenase catalytic domain-containing protein [Candidatus Binataceae bacterium]
MKACVFKAPGAPLEVTELPDPKAGPGEVVVRVKNCGICGSDLHAVQWGVLPAGTVMGHEFSAVVDELGAGVSGFQPGDPVMVVPMIPCGECDFCRTGQALLCTKHTGIGFEAPGAYAEKVKTRPGSLLKMPPGLSHRAAATVEPTVVGLHGIHRSKLMVGETCVVMGAGPIGLVTTMWARFAGARAVVVSEMAEGRRAMALKMGADLVVNPKERSPVQELVKMTGAGPDVVFECIGVPGTIDEAIRFARKGGRVVVIGACGEPDKFTPIRALRREVDLIFSNGSDAREFDTAMALLASGRVSTDPMITHTVGIEEFPRAFAALSHPNEQCKVMLEF